LQRPTGVQIEAQTLLGTKFKMTLDGFEARVFQHEYDHLDGVLFQDRMSGEVLGTIQGKLDALVENPSRRRTETALID
jgi:peptide deformylase